MAAPRYCVNRAEVVDEVIDGEAVMINLTTGSYYCTNATGALVWEALAGGNTVAGVAAVLSSRFDTASADLGADIESMLADLREQGLVVAGDDQGAADEVPGGGTKPYEPPRLETFTDLQDLLLLDPVHDVGARGWPHTGG